MCGYFSTKGIIESALMFGMMAKSLEKSIFKDTAAAPHVKVQMPKAKYKAHKASKKSQRKARRK